MSPHVNSNPSTTTSCALMTCGKGKGYQWKDGKGQLTTYHVGVLENNAAHQGFRGRNQLTDADFECEDCPTGTCSDDPESGQCRRPEGESVSEYNAETCAVVNCADDHTKVTVDSTDPFSRLDYGGDNETNLGCVFDSVSNNEAIGRYNQYVDGIDACSN